MKMAFWLRNKAEELRNLEREAALVHQRKISAITRARENSDKLREVLKQNNITIELAKAIGH